VKKLCEQKDRPQVDDKRTGQQNKTKINNTLELEDGLISKLGVDKVP
jgi:hypothetical protein